MLEVFNTNLQRLAILENAFEIEEVQKINTVWRLTFRLPSNDFKNEYCQSFNYVRFDGKELYRILPVSYSFEEQSFNDYECEHVLATLIDDPLIGWHKVGNIGYFTKKVIEYVLEHQTIKRWQLDECDFTHQFEYGWEKENLASALFSIPLPFTAQYIWVTDTTTSPWKVSLKRLNINAIPKHYLRTGHNIFSLTRKSDPTKICTRIYPYGAGEGVNQLLIDTVNDGKPYLDASQETISKYGLKVLQWSDRRYTDAESLKGAGQSILDELSVPYVEYSVSNLNINANIGDVVQVVDDANKIKYNNIVVEIRRKYGETTEEQITIANKPQDVASNITDLADRQRIEQNYSQGATQHYSVVYSDNADSDNPTELNFFIPQEMLIINEIKLKVKLEQFRAYSKSTSQGGSKQTSSSTNEIASTSDSGGSITKTTSEWNQTTGAIYIPDGYNPYRQYVTSYEIAYWEGHKHRTQIRMNGALNGETDGTDEQSFNHVHRIDHAHSVAIPSHNHSFRTPSHSHTLDTTHSHDITPIIAKLGNANSFAIIVNGVQKKIINGYDFEGDIEEYLVSGGSISRGVWHTVGIKPLGNDGKARPHMSLHFSGFVQSRGDKRL